MFRFEWDEANRNHILYDYPERNNTVEEVESTFDDPFLIIALDRIVAGEERYTAVGIGTNNIVRVVVFVFQNDFIRPISSWAAKKKIQKFYHEQRRKKEERN